MVTAIGNHNFAGTKENIVITYLYYDGTHGRNELDEYVVIQNQGNSPVDLLGWTLPDETGKAFFSPAFEITPGQEC